MEFKIGDRVKIIDGNGISGLKGKEGIIRVINGSVNKEYGIEFDEPFNGGHNLSGRLNNRNGRFFKQRHFKEIVKINIFLNETKDKFKGKRANVIQNGNTYKLVKSNGKVLYTYIPEKELKRIIDTKDKTEKMYIELFEQAIKEFNDSKE